jgi:hypothetical protein
MFNAIVNNISIISWWSVLLVEETGVPGENQYKLESFEKLLIVNATRKNML